MTTDEMCMSEVVLMYGMAHVGRDFMNPPRHGDCIIELPHNFRQMIEKETPQTGSTGVARVHEIDQRMRHVCVFMARRERAGRSEG